MLSLGRMKQDFCKFKSYMVRCYLKNKQIKEGKIIVKTSNNCKTFYYYGFEREVIV